jgi:hypothetical protein
MRPALSLGLATVLLAPSALGQTLAAAPEPAPPLARRSAPRLVTWNARLWTLGLRADVGSAYGYGVGALRTVETGVWSGGPGGSLWFSLGGDLRVLTADHARVDAVLGSAVARVSSLGCAGGGALEAALGVAGGLPTAANASPAVVPVAHLGIFLGVHWLELGYTYQFPLGTERPSWLSSHQFSVRVELPLSRFETRREEGQVQ